MKEDAYTQFVYSSWLVTLVACICCYCAMSAAFVLPFFTPHRFDYSYVKQTRTYLLSTVTLVIILLVLMWVIRSTTLHRDVVDDLQSQLIESMDTFLGKALDDAFKMVKQAALLWTFTGMQTVHAFYSKTHTQRQVVLSQICKFSTHGCKNARHTILIV